MIPFNIPPVTGKELDYIQDVIRNRKFSGDGKYTMYCQKWIEETTGTKKALLTTSCTHALEMAALLIGIVPGDEVIMPSFTFTSTANAFVLRGAKIVFVDIRPETMNMDETKIEAAITERTKAIVVVHYAGVACEMDEIIDIAKRYKLVVVEDAAQALMGRYKGQMLGTIGHLATYSFHETKNFVSGEGGALLINDDRYIERAEIIREKGTNRTQFLKGRVAKYNWQDLGSSYLPSELNAAFLYAQLQEVEQLLQSRLSCWNDYYISLKSLEEENLIELPVIPNYCQHNGHLLFMKVKDGEERTNLIKVLKEQGIECTSHYVPLHSSPAGHQFSVFRGEDLYTTKESERLVRLPLFSDLTSVETVCLAIKRFYTGV